MTRSKILLLCGALAFMPAVAGAQSLGERTGVNSALGVTPSTPDFVSELAMSDMFELASNKLAVERGAFKNFADEMVTDHTKTTTELKDMVANGAAPGPLPTAMSSSQQSMLDKLKSLQGDDFAKQFASDQVSAHKDAVSLFERYGKGGENDKLKAFATATLPTLQHHLDIAQKLAN